MWHLLKKCEEKFICLFCMSCHQWIHFTKCNKSTNSEYAALTLTCLNLGFFDMVHVPNFRELSGSEDRVGGDNSIQFINFGRMGDKSFKEWLQKIGGWKGG